MYNGTGMSVKVNPNLYLSASTIPYGSTFIPFPGKPDSVLLLYASLLYIEHDGLILDVCSEGISGAIISKGSGQVLERRFAIIENDTLIRGNVITCRHANGRDWWLLSFKRNTNKYHRILIDPEGFHLLEIGEVNLPITNGANTACFAPDGTKFAVYNAVTFLSDGGVLDLFDFDRCTGMLYNQIQIKGRGTYGGLAFSPNSRYLYHNKLDTAYQYDLWAANIPASRHVVAVYDGFKDPFSTTFYMLQAAPDGKIYGSATNGTRYLHVIHNPDEAGTDCQYQQHGIQLLKYNDFSLPNFPNYRLGPLDGSPCDTLGIDNEPKAWWRYEQDTLDALAVEFRDLSYYEPATWAWDFGDGSPASSTRHPQHQYAQPGAYQVCLTVSNQYGTDTHCKTLYLGVTAQDNPVLQAQVLVWHNPFRERFAVALSANLRSPALRLYDAAGRLVLEQRLVFGVNEIEAAGLPPGLYFWEVVAGGERVKSGKSVKLAE
ncbi:MAG: PKD domain-containing protein [Saprospiraceae bacterium]|nr:PKD domain-containing protein [Saprospiraceae bacterium]